MLRSWKIALGFLFSIMSWSAFADFDDVRARWNESYSNFLKGDCDSIVHPNCSVANDPMSVTGLKTLVTNLSPVVYSEDMFFQKAAARQVDFLRCDISQLSNMTRRDPQSLKFQSMVLSDIYNKLPELRVHYKIMQDKKSLVSEYQKQIDAEHAAVARSMKTPQQAQDAIREISEKMEVEMKVLNPESSAYHTLLSSIWRADDPQMSNFILRMVNSSRDPKVLYDEAMRPTAADGYLRQWTGTAEFSFQEQVLEPMKAEAQKNLENITSQNGNFDFSTKKTLVRDSEWSEALTQAGIDGETASAKLMCTLDKKYVSGDEATIQTLEVGSLLVGGVGVVSKVFSAAKFARLLNPGVARGLLIASRVTTAASVFAFAPVVAEQIQSDCFGNSPSVMSKGANRCDPNDLAQYEQVERKRMEQENCALAVVMGAASLVPVHTIAGAVKEMNFTTGFVERFKGYRTIFRRAEAAAPAADEAFIALAQAEKAAVEESVEEIVVTAKPRRKPKAVVESRQPASETLDLEVVDTVTFDAEIEKLIGKKPTLEEREAFIEILERTQAVGKDREAFFAARSPDFKTFHDKWRLELAKNPEKRKELRRYLTEVGEARLAAGELKLQQEVDELAASGKVEVGPNGKPEEIDCQILNRFYGGAFPKNGKCYRVKAKENLEGEYCGCGAAGKKAFGFTLKCPKSSEDFRNLTKYFDHIALPTLSKLEMCARVDIPKGKECYTGNTTLTFAGYGGGTQLLCIDSKRFGDKQAIIDEFGIDVGGNGISLSPKRWSPFSDFESISAIIHDASIACPEKCSPQDFMRLSGLYRAERGRLERLYANDPAKLSRLEEEKVLFDEYFQNLRNGRQDLPSDSVIERLNSLR